jgi:esterase FrsA
MENPMNRLTGLRIVIFLVAVSTLFGSAFAQEPARARTLDEIKAESMIRSKQGMYPLIGLDPTDVQDALARITTLDPDDWAQGWIAVGDKYMERAKQLEATNKAEANTDYLRAWNIYHFGSWPVPTSPGKERAYAKSLTAFLAHGRLMDPAFTVVHIPFEGSEIVGYLRLPKDMSKPVPFVIAINGADSRKENMSTFFDLAIPYGIGYIAVDTPGTGQAPLKESPTADRMYSRVIDYLETRPEIDKTRIAAEGQSYGAYWATKLAIVERNRLKCVVAQSPGIHAGFVRAYDPDALLRNREYLFGIQDVMAYLYGVKTPQDAAAIAPKMSLVNQGLIGKPTTPMLIIAGVKDTLVPMSDIELLLDNGDIPKDAWINPQGGHLGRQVGTWPDPVIFNQVIIPWLGRKLNVEMPQPVSQ